MKSISAEDKKKRLFFPCDKNNQIKNAIDRIDLVIKLTGLPSSWNIVFTYKTIYLSVNNGSNILSFDFNKDDHVTKITIFQSQLDDPYRIVNVSKKNLEEVLSIINEFKILI